MEPPTELAGKRTRGEVVALIVGVPLVILLLVVAPLALGIGIPMMILADHTALPNIAIAAIAIPFGIGVFVFLYYAAAKGWVTIGDD